MFFELKEELKKFYGQELHGLHEESMKVCAAALEQSIPDDIPAIEQKKLQYEILSRTVRPVLFRHTLLYGEVCANEARETATTMGNWTLQHNGERYRELGSEVYEEKCVMTSYPLYAFCGEFGDEIYHFAFENGKILKAGFRGIYERVCARLREAGLPEEERQWLEAVRTALLSVKTVMERFADAAKARAEEAEDASEKAHFEAVSEMAARIPWEKPETFTEALETIQFIQSVVPALEGGGLYSVGRLDLLLIDFYLQDLKNGTLTREEAKKLIGEFLLLHDMRIPHDQENQNDSLVNAVYTLGGVDRDGKHVFNEVTKLFLEVDKEEEIIYPKIKCRFDAASPAEYLDLINSELKEGKSTLLYQNDHALIPALERAGIATEDARDYSILGCWEPVIPGCTNEHCSYFHTLKIFELSVYGGLKDPRLPFEIRPLEEAESFEEVLSLTLQNIHAVMESRTRVAVGARKHWYEVDPHPLLSSVLDDCIAKGRDLTNGGARYSHDEIICSGLPNVIDSLLVIKELCFEKNICTVKELLAAVRNNWADAELRHAALKCHFFGDESEESTGLMRQVTEDFSDFANTLPALFGGRVTIGYMLFMEMYQMAEKIRATPDGRFSGDYFSRGLTPSTLHPIESITGVINCFAGLDPTGMAANSVLNVTVPFKDMSLALWESFIRSAAETAVNAFQINCASKEELLDAMEHPELHQSLIVRVCGFSARFVTLPEHVQRDFLERNFFHR